MKRVAFSVLIGLLSLASTAWSAQVNNVELSYRDGLTVARIDIDGPVRYTHLTEIPKNGRPDRLIVDVLSATHELGAKVFDELPPCIVTGIRSSQFSVTPEKIVRVVFDLSTAPLYRVTSDDRSITITFDHKEAGSFASWSTASTVAAMSSPKAPAAPVMASVKPTETKIETARTPAKSAVETNKVIESDRMLSLADSKPAAPKDQAPAPVSSPAPVPAQKVDRSLSGRNFSEAQTAPVKTAVSNAPAKEASLPVEVVAPPKKAEAAPTVAQPVKKDPVAEPKPASVTNEPPAANPPAATPQKAVEPEAEKSAKPVPSPLPPSKTKADLAQQPAPAPSTTSGQQALAQKVTKTDDPKPAPTVAKKDAAPQPSADANPRPTARFRRKGESAKIRGTMVAEFPKRLVIKYQADGRRDPFASLLDAQRTYDDPIGNRVPNVEGLRLVGIIESDGATNRALFEDKAGFSYILKSGDKVRNGYVLRVESDQVYFQIFEYGWSRTVALTME
jgi:hypothetical protein